MDREKSLVFHRGYSGITGFDKKKHHVSGAIEVSYPGKYLHMGIKGDKIKKASIEANSELLDALAVVVGVSSKKMFGGHGIFHESKMFGIVDSKGQFFLKVNESTKSEFVNKGGFQHSRMPYFSVPDDILNNNNELITWVTKSIEASKS